MLARLNNNEIVIDVASALCSVSTDQIFYKGLMCLRYRVYEMYSRREQFLLRTRDVFEASDFAAHASLRLPASI